MAAYGMTILRVAVGAIYLMQAYLALFVATPRGTAAFLAKTISPPTPTLVALLVIIILGVGGALLVLGVFTRLVAGANALVLLLGLLGIYLRQGVVSRGALLDVATGRAAPAGYEYIGLLLASTIALALIGPGAATLGRAK